MECFDPIGNLRHNYRSSKGIERGFNVGLRFLHKDYDLGPIVDSSGVTAEGAQFSGIREYKQLLLESTEQVARNLLYRLFAFATGADIQFADRREVERILTETKTRGYPLRSLIHHVVASPIFRNR